MKRIDWFYQRLPQVAKVFVDLCFNIGLLVFVGKVVAPLFALTIEWLYKMCKAITLFIFPDISHDAKIIILAVGLFSVPLLIMLFRSILSKIVSRLKRKHI